MKVSGLKISRKKTARIQAMEDRLYLQKRISGASVYNKISTAYRRVPKHKNRSYLSESY